MKRVYKLIAFILFSFILIGTVKANSVDKVSMDIYVDNNGNAHIKEIWDTYVNKGTESYHPYFNLGNSNITINSVTDDTGAIYNLNDNWNVDDSFNTKKDTYGIYKTGDETDICWGISKYGSRLYTVNYTITNFISNTTDGYQILYWQLFPYDFSVEPDNVYIKVYADNKFSDNLDVWGYGNYGGTAYVYDGYIEMQSNGTLDSSEYMTMLVKFPSNTFTTANKIDKTFDEIYNEADEGTTHYNKSFDFWEDVFPFIFVFGTIIVVLVCVFSNGFGTSDKIKNKTYPKKPLPFRDLPCQKDLYFAYLIAREYHLNNKQTELLGAILLKWIKNNNVTITTEEKGIFKTKTTKIVLLNCPIDSIPLEQDLYHKFEVASKDNILEANEFKKYCTTNYKSVLEWFDKVIDDKIDTLKDTEYLSNSTKKGIFNIEKTEVSATNALNEKAMQMAGLKVFFKEFTRMHEKTAIEVKMWQEYLMYAQILGMAKEVAKEFKDMYPDIITDDTYDTFILVNDFSYYGMQAASVARNEAIARANSYSAGGGGFSSGGGGGGSFGGGGGGGGFR